MNYQTKIDVVASALMDTEGYLADDLGPSGYRSIARVVVDALSGAERACEQQSGEATACDPEAGGKSLATVGRSLATAGAVQFRAPATNSTITDNEPTK